VVKGLDDLQITRSRRVAEMPHYDLELLHVALQKIEGRSEATQNCESVLELKQALVELIGSLELARAMSVEAEETGALYQANNKSLYIRPMKPNHSSSAS
jgi:hypothetical protein